MKLCYIAPSTLPSRAANAVHVAMQCEALAQLGVQVTLFARRASPREPEMPALLREAYGMTFPGGKLVSFYMRTDRATSWILAILALLHLHAAREKPDAIVSRNLYASFLLGVLERRPLLFETHQLETRWRKVLQRLIMTRPWVQTIVISSRQLDCLKAHHGVLPSHPIVLHDAAPEGEAPLPSAERREALQRLLPEAKGSWRAVIGYFGHLYPGRGIEVIEGMARARPECLFLVFGGNESDVARLRLANDKLPNLRFMGYVTHAKAQEAMRRMDILLMPYQAKVSIGVSGHDTADFMSPMKMFEYMASGVPLVSSDLPVLREVLRDRENALLVPAGAQDKWVEAADLLINDPALAERLSARAFADFKERHTWAQRARRMKEAAQGAL